MESFQKLYIWCTFDIEKVYRRTCCVIIFPYVLLRIRALTVPPAINFPEKSFMRREFDLQSRRVVSDIRCSASRRARPSTCVTSVCLGVATGTKGAIKPRRFVSRPVLNLVEPQPPALLRIRQLAWGHQKHQYSHGR